MNCSFIKPALPYSVALSLLMSSQFSLAAPIDGSSATVSPGDVPEDWSLTNGATLNVLPGGETGTITATRGSTVNLDQSTTTSSGIALELQQGSTAVVTGASLTSTGDYGLLIAGSFPNGLRSQATVTNSEISGFDRGVSVAIGDVTLSGTTVYGRDAGGTGFLNGGIGLALFAAKATVTNGSSIVGDKNGVLISADSGGGDAGRFSELTVDNSTIEGKTGSAIIVGSYRDDRPSDATVTIQNGSTLIGGNGVILEVANNSNANVFVDNSNLVGDVVVEAGSSANLTLKNNAILTGQLTNVGKLALNSGGTWNMVGDASVGDLTMDGGYVNLGGGPSTYRTLTLGSLSGNGTFALGSDIAAGKGDFLNVTGQAAGDFNLKVQNTGLEPAKDADLKVVHTGGGDAKFGLVGGQVDIGTYAYDLKKVGDDWFLVQRDDGGPVVTPGARSVLGLFSAAPTVWYGELSTLRSRMGELRYGNGEGGLWMRSYGNKFNQSAGGGVEYQQTQQGISFGADAALPTNNGQWLVGLLGGYSKSDLDLKGGTTGKVDSYYVGVYTSWLADNGYYIDALIKANRFKNKSNVLMSDGEKSGGDYTTSGVGASVEAGRHIALSNDWFVEPFVQVSTLWVEGESYDLDNGMQAKSNHADSVLGKVGTNIGRNFELAGGTKLQPYLKLAVAEEFAKSNRVKVNDNSFSNDLSGTRGEIGAGIAVQLTKGIQLHADVDYMNGENIEQPWNVNFGASYRW